MECKDTETFNIAVDSQAGRIVAAFGTVTRLLEGLESVGVVVARSSVHKWMCHTGDRGTGGLIPSHRMPYIIEAAKKQGIILNAAVLYPHHCKSCFWQ